MRLIVLSVLLAALTGCTTPAASAQQGPQPVNAALIRLHDDLRLSSDQEGDWKEYTLAVAPNADVLARHRATSELLPLVPTPRRIALLEATMAQDSLDFKRQGAAVDAFYGKLSPEQQRVFDRDTQPSASDGAGDLRSDLRR